MRCRSIVLCMFFAACAVETDKGPEENAPSVEGKDDSLRRPTDHGVIPFGVTQTARLTAAQGHHAWQFELSGDAQIHAFTGPNRDGELDTVLYLYRQRADGTWGPYIARNDDSGGTLWSSVERGLGAGVYRVTVKGYTAAERGRFDLDVDCSGAGCAPAVAECVFGSTFYELPEQPGLVELGRDKITVESWLSDLDRQRVVLAVQQSSHTDVTTVEEAFERVDQNEINRVFIDEPAARRRFVAFEYGAGDNSYGAIFEHHTAEIVTSIHDGDLLDCETPAGVCLLPESYNALIADPAFEAGTTIRVDDPADVSGLAAEQVIASVASVYADVTTVLGAIEAADELSIRFTPITHLATGADLVIVEFGAGDTSVGLVFHGGGTEWAAVISDGSIEGCDFLE
jgi:hypothetical protein